MRIIPLGTNGFFPSHGRQTMCTLVLTDDRVIALDAGSGLGRLMEAGVRDAVEGYENLDIVLSHYHLDHVIGLSYLSAAWPRGRVRLFAPGPPWVDATPEDALSGLLAPPLFGATLEDMGVEVIAFSENQLDVGGLTFRLRRQTHPGGSVGFRLGDELAYMTDTVVDEGSAEFADGVRLLLHEVWLTEAESADSPASEHGHSDVGEVRRLVERAGVGRLLPVHHHPKRSNIELAELVQALGTAEGVIVRLPEEGRIYSLG